MRHRTNVVRNHDPSPCSRPREDHRVVDSGKADFLDANDVYCRLPAPQPANNVVVEVLVGEKSKHGFLRLGCPPREETLANAVRRVPSLVLPANRFMLLPLFGKIRFGLRASAEIETDRGVDIRQIEYRELFGDFLRRGTLPVSGHNRVQGDARTANTDDPVGVCFQWNRIAIDN